MVIDTRGMREGIFNLAVVTCLVAALVAATMWMASIISAHGHSVVLVYILAGLSCVFIMSLCIYLNDNGYPLFMECLTYQLLRTPLLSHQEVALEHALHGRGKAFEASVFDQLCKSHPKDLSALEAAKLLSLCGVKGKGTSIPFRMPHERPQLDILREKVVEFHAMEDATATVSSVGASRARL